MKHKILIAIVLAFIEACVGSVHVAQAPFPDEKIRSVASTIPMVTVHFSPEVSARLVSEKYDYELSRDPKFLKLFERILLSVLNTRLENAPCAKALKQLSPSWDFSITYRDDPSGIGVLAIWPLTGYWPLQPITGSVEILSRFGFKSDSLPDEFNVATTDQKQIWWYSFYRPGSFDSMIKASLERHVDSIPVDLCLFIGTADGK
ncbi:hypothetical protein CH373_06220 [Leptospira perolatii]|uniref:Lipoprotein n=1 Tax=Leptospira perolatii TaxID=2023191 RepID=A0A2M9ZNV7_9LEPT|nr:hypothetical protein [Leptospira perolatii]PJZ70860.1 hypothetical protein CH360_04950 [Leptospira perolatii]PJZ73756.1 hypothetical protein CH373_06220 [Leptospira perolatii]